MYHCLRETFHKLIGECEVKANEENEKKLFFSIEDAYIVCFLFSFVLLVYRYQFFIILLVEQWIVTDTWLYAFDMHQCFVMRVYTSERKTSVLVACEISTCRCHHFGTLSICTKNRFCHREKSWCSHISKREEQISQYFDAFNPITRWNIEVSE